MLNAVKVSVFALYADAFTAFSMTKAICFKSSTPQYKIKKILVKHDVSQGFFSFLLKIDRKLQHFFKRQSIHTSPNLIAHT